MNEVFWRQLESLIDSAKLVIDRPKGSSHPRYGSFIYPLDYGYLDGTSSNDGNGIDVWLGSKKDLKLCAILCTIGQLKRDVEAKLLLGCTEAELQTILEFHHTSDHLAGIIIRRPESL